MLNVSLLLLDGCWGSQLLGVLDFVSIYRLVAQQRGRGDAIEVTCYGLAAKQLALGYGASIAVQALPDLPPANSLLIVPGIEYGRLQQALNLPVAERERIKAFISSGSAVLGLSTGAFIVAEAGLLDGREAVTHRQFAEQFRRRYPAVTLKSGVEYVDVGRAATAASLAGAIYWLARQLQKAGNADIVERCLALAQQNPALAAGLWLADSFAFKQHTDAGILQLQQFIDDHYAEEFTLADLAGEFGFSESSLKRRFRQAAGLPVNKYCQLVRMARMKYLLLQSNLTVDTICFDIGYADPRFARRLFVAQTGCSPREFRQRNRVDAEAGSASEFL